MFLYFSESTAVSYLSCTMEDSQPIHRKPSYSKFPASLLCSTTNHSNGLGIYRNMKTKASLNGEDQAAGMKAWTVTHGFKKKKHMTISEKVSILMSLTAIGNKIESMDICFHKKEFVNSFLRHSKQLWRTRWTTLSLYSTRLMLSLKRDSKSKEAYRNSRKFW